MACSVIIGLLLLKQVSLTHALYEEERSLGDNEEIAGSATAYENAWKQLAIRIFENGRNDANLMAVLHSLGINVRERPNPGSNAPSTAPAPAQPGAKPTEPAAPASGH